MPDFVVENPCSLAMLKKIAAYERCIFTADAMPSGRMQELWEKNPFMFTVLRSGNKFLGYFSIFALNSKGEEIFMKRKGIDLKLRADCVHNPKEMHKTRIIYFDAIVAVGSGEERKNLAAMLMYARAYFVENRFKLPNTIYVIPTTPEGRKLVNSYGGARWIRASITHKVYWMYRVRATKAWCRSVRARASKRAAPKLRFAIV